jgi:hypothetical protein
MTHTQTNTNNPLPEKKRKKAPLFRVTLTVLGLLLALFVLKVFLIVIAVPNVSVDYQAEYSELIKPADYDANENAANYYQEVFDHLVDMPPVIARMRESSLDDTNETELNMLKAWLALNSWALVHLQVATRRPYYWVPRHSSWFDRGIVDVIYPEPKKFQTVGRCLDFKTKLSLRQGETQGAFEDVITLYKVGAHLSGARPLIEQLVGMRLKAIARRHAFMMLVNQSLRSETLKEMQVQLGRVSSKSTAKLDFRSERYLVYDTIQHTFTDNGRGSGFLIPRKAAELIGPAIISLISPTRKQVEQYYRERYLKFFWVAVVGPSRAKTVASVDEYSAHMETLKSQTLWKLHKKGLDSDQAISSFGKSWFVKELVPSLFSTVETYQRCKAEESALLGTIAILHYKADRGGPPEILDELVSAGYLRDLPMDPYSDKPLVYKRLGDDFALYSLGADFDDDGGVPSKWGEGEEGGDMVFWPVERAERKPN